MSLKRMIMLCILLVIGVIIVGFIVPKETKPSSTTRVILEHNEKTYIAPPCFQEADASNFIAESSLEQANELNYSPHSACTEGALKGEKDSLLVSLLKDIGFIKKKWETW